MLSLSAILTFLIAAPHAFGSIRDAPILGLHFSEVAIEGNHMADVPILLRELKYKIVRTSWATDWDQMSDVLDKYGMDQYRVTKAAYFTHGWTYIVDPEMVPCMDPILAKETLRLKARIVGWVCKSTSGSYGFYVYGRGHLIRDVLAVDGKLAESVGPRLGAEKAVDWKAASEQDIVALAGRLGPCFDPSTASLKFRIFDLDEHGMTQH